MRRLKVSLVLGGLLVSFTCVLAQAQIKVTPRATTETLKLQPVAMLKLTPAMRLQEYNQLLATNKAPEAQRAELQKQFQAAPEDLQDAILMAQSDKWAEMAQLSPVYVERAKYKITIDRGVVLQPIMLLSYVWPREGGYPGGWCFAFGTQLNANCKILFDGTQLATNYIGYWDEFYGNSLAFKVPAGATKGANHNVQAKNTANNRTSNTVSYRVSAPRGYRGYHGWRFANFGNPTIPWHLYRDFFGTSAVEYGNGTPRPAALAWYNSAYKGVGGGGNCYGMSVSSLKLYAGDFNTYHKNWFANPANHQNFTWWYPWCTQSKESVQEDQGGQLSAELATYINAYYHSQSARDVYTRAAGNLIPTRPVLGMWSGSGGHAIVPYGARNPGNLRELLCYDNNVPYNETESGGPDRSIANINWSNNSFSYGGYNKAVCLTYNECKVPPHLPASAASAMGALSGTNSKPGETTICVINGAAPSQITDENGRRFYNANGTENSDQASRIPLAMRFLPLTGAPTQPGDPLFFLFNDAQGKSLTFNLADNNLKVLNVFSPGMVLSATGQGPGQVRVANLGTANRELVLLNPDTFRPTQVEVVHSQASGDRRFLVTNLQDLGNQEIRFVPAPDGGQLEISSPRALRFNLQLSSPSGQGAQQANFAGLALQAGQRAVLRPSNWNNLGAGLNLQLRNLQNNQLLRQQNLRPGQ